VLVIDGEMPALALQERFKRIWEHRHGGGARLRIVASDLHPDG